MTRFDRVSILVLATVIAVMTAAGMYSIHILLGEVRTLSQEVRSLVQVTREREAQMENELKHEHHCIGDGTPQHEAHSHTITKNRNDFATVEEWKRAYVTAITESFTTHPPG